jgi:hypothetical protein
METPPVPCHAPPDVATLTPAKLVAVFSEWYEPMIRLERDGEFVHLWRPQNKTGRQKLETLIHKVFVGEQIQFLCRWCGRVQKLVEVVHG